METIAIYCEPIIKTYGITERTGLSLITLLLPMENSDPRCLQYLEAIQKSDNVIVIFAPSLSDGCVRLHLLFDGSPLSSIKGAKPLPGVQVEESVELLYFHGPHYGDRYGIADAALGALADGKIPLRAMSCSGASVYIVVPEGFARQAGKALSRAFVVPSTNKGND